MDAGRTWGKADAVHTPLTSLHLLDALRKGDRSAIESILSGQDWSAPRPHLESPLHLAVLCAEPPTIDYVLKQSGMDPNLRTSDTGNTPLHLAVSSNRPDAAALLLSLPTINDNLRNADGKTPMELVTSPDMMHLLQCTCSVLTCSLAHGAARQDYRHH